jgi:hypothetical protein
MVPKVATHSIRLHLKNYTPETVYYHGFNHYPIQLYDDYYKFAFVRNPFDRLVSCWVNKVVNKNHFKFNDKEYAEMQTFANFIGYVKGLDLTRCERHLRHQSSLIDLNQVNFLGRLENIDADYMELCKILNLPYKKLENRNSSSNRKNYRDYYDDKLVEEVSKLYVKDLRLFNYSF